jgi:hypothetical protein
MKRNIFFEIQYEPEDFLPLFLKEISLDNFEKVIIREETAQGFFTNRKLANRGIYILYKNEQPIYVGCSESSIHKRIGRFISGVRGTERPDENHSAAYKYIDIFGRDLSDITVKTISISPQDLPEYINLTDIENTLIYSLKPLLNSETHYDYKFEKGIKIVSISEKNARFI